MLSEQMQAALTVAGRELASASRREQGLPPRVEDAATIAAFVDLWSLPDPTQIPRATAPARNHHAGGDTSSSAD